MGQGQGQLLGKQWAVCHGLENVFSVNVSTDSSPQKYNLQKGLGTSKILFLCFSLPEVMVTVHVVLYYKILYSTVLYCQILHSTMLYCQIIHSTMLYFKIVNSTMLYYNVQYSTILYYKILYGTMLYYCKIQT